MTSGEEGREARKLRIGVSGNMEKTLGRVGWHGVFWIFFSVRRCYVAKTSRVLKICGGFH